MGDTYYDIPLTGGMIEDIQQLYIEQAKESKDYEIIDDSVNMVDYLEKEWYTARYKINNDYKETKFREWSLIEFIEWIKNTDDTIDNDKFVELINRFKKYISNLNISSSDEYSKLHEEIDKTFNDMKGDKYKR